MSAEGNQARLAEIREIIRTRFVGTQEDLRHALRARGFSVTQATLSRDLARLKARRVSLPEGGGVYELEEAKVMDDPRELARVAPMVLRIDHNDSLVVALTEAGAASAVALALDRSRLPQLLGTIAGDDTVFIAPARGTSAAALNALLQDIWKKGER